MFVSVRLLCLLSYIIKEAQAATCFFQNNTSVCTYSFKIEIVSKGISSKARCTNEESIFLQNRLEYHTTQLANAKFGITALDTPLISNDPTTTTTTPLTSNPTRMPTTTTNVSSLSPQQPSPIPTFVLMTSPPTSRPIRKQPTNPPTEIPTERQLPDNSTLLPTKLPTNRPNKIKRHLRTEQHDLDDVETKNRDSITENSVTMTSRKLPIGRFVWGGSSSWTCQGCGTDNVDPAPCAATCPKPLNDQMSLDLTRLMNEDVNNRREVVPFNPDGCLSKGDMTFYFIETGV